MSKTRTDLKQVVIDAEHDDHVFIHVRTAGDHPGLSIDIANEHGRRTLSVRVGGMTIGGFLVDLKELDPVAPRAWTRFCPYCAEELDLFSSRPHVCENED